MHGLRIDPELAKIRERFRKNPYTPSGRAKPMPKKLYAVFAETRYAPACRSSKAVQADIQKIREVACPQQIRNTTTALRRQ